MSNQPSDLQVQQKVLYLLDLGQKEYQKYIYENYLNTEEIPLFMREFYSESSSWFTNKDIDSMKSTIHWSTINDSQKLTKRLTLGIKRKVSMEKNYKV